MTHDFPDADAPAIQPFTQAFVGMMFAHAAFEHRVSALMNAITGDEGFGERTSLGTADKRPKRMQKLINEHHPDGLPEADAIVACLKRSISFCRSRNLLAHGRWWRFDIEANAITVRPGVARSNQGQHPTLTVADIRHVGTSLKDLEVELWKRQTAIEARGPHHQPAV